MTFQDYADTFFKTACDVCHCSDFCNKGAAHFSFDEAIEISWQAFNRLLISQGLGIMPLDPTQRFEIEDNR